MLDGDGDSIAERKHTLHGGTQCLHQSIAKSREKRSGWDPVHCGRELLALPSLELYGECSSFLLLCAPEGTLCRRQIGAVEFPKA